MKKKPSVGSWILCVFFVLCGLVYFVFPGILFLFAAVLICPAFRARVKLPKKSWIPAVLIFFFAGVYFAPAEETAETNVTRDMGSTSQSTSVSIPAASSSSEGSKSSSASKPYSSSSAPLTKGLVSLPNSSSNNPVSRQSSVQPSSSEAPLPSSSVQSSSLVAPPPSSSVRSSNSTAPLPNSSVQSDSSAAPLPSSSVRSSSSKTSSAAPYILSSSSSASIQASSSAAPSSKALPANKPNVVSSTANNRNNNPFTEVRNDFVPETTYVLNNNTKKIHDSDCSSVKTIKPENYSETNKTVEELKAAGYKPCGKCKPS